MFFRYRKYFTRKLQCFYIMAFFNCAYLDFKCSHVSRLLARFERGLGTIRARLLPLMTCHLDRVRRGCGALHAFGSCYMRWNKPIVALFLQGWQVKSWEYEVIKERYCEMLVRKH